MEENDRNWHPDFRSYTEEIAKHPNYKGLPIGRTRDGRLGWVVIKDSEKGRVRDAWWSEKVRELHVKNKAEAARKIHPTKLHVCQCCGRAMSIYYEYPAKNTCKKLSEVLGVTINQADYTIRELIENYAGNENAIKDIASIFKITKYESVRNLIDIIYKKYVYSDSRRFSPGVMGDPPDRFDGFHSDGLCCRSLKDKGRNPDNLKTYNQDRRAYEEWADGDYNLANRLMGEFGKGTRMYRCPECNKLRKMTADHIGPISLGFCHSINNLAPLCNACNRSKNNRFTKADINALKAIESKGIQIISWHSAYVWDALKNSIFDDGDALRLSSVMVTCHQNVLKLFSLIYTRTGPDFLKHYLHPEFSMYDYRFENFDPLDLSKLVIRKKELDSTNKRKNRKRVMRVAFEALEEFDRKNNRRTRVYINAEDVHFTRLIHTIESQPFEMADAVLKAFIERLSRHIIHAEWGR